MIQDPSPGVGMALKMSGGGWGAVFVGVGLLVGLIMALAQPAPMHEVCVSRTFDGCMTTIETLDRVAQLGTAALGIFLGSFVGLGAWKIVGEVRKALVAP